MTGIHVIRLRGPWSVEPVARSFADDREPAETSRDALPASGTVRMPGDWSVVLGSDYLGTARYRRRFGCPGGLQPGDRVWLVVESVRARAQVALASQSLGSIEGWQRQRFEVTTLLQQRNELSIEVECRASDLSPGNVSGPPPGSLGEVRLEIDSGGA